MHELGTILYVIKTVEALAEENELKTVASVTLEVGEVSGIVPEFLTDYWEYSKKKTTYLTDSTLKIETIPAVTYCENCQKTYSTVQHGKTCPYCGGGSTYLLKGNEYTIKEIEGC